MPTVKAYAALTPTSPLGPFQLERREPGPKDVVIDVLFCGVCHSDIHQARDEWGGSLFPMVPGHEVLGRVSKVGAQVTAFKPGDLAGVGCMVNSCGGCAPCDRHLQQYCEKGPAWTYNGTEMDRTTRTYGGYSKQLVVAEAFGLHIPANLDPAGAAPLLCAGITTWSPLRTWKAGKGTRVGVVGLGGLGHMAVKLAAALGAEVTLLSTSAGKEADARRLGAHEFGLTTEPATFKRFASRFDLIIDAASGRHDFNAYLDLLRLDGTMVLVGAPPEPAPVKAFSLFNNRRRLAGTLNGGIRETQEMLDFCGAHKLTADVEVIPMEQINTAYQRMMKGDVRYRFSIDLATL